MIMKRFKFLDSALCEFDMAYYDTNEFTFIGVSATQCDLDDDRPYKVMIFKHDETGTFMKGNLIRPNHPMYNINCIMNYDRL